MTITSTKSLEIKEKMHLLLLERKEIKHMINLEERNLLFDLFRRGKQIWFDTLRTTMQFLLNPTFLKIAALAGTFAYLKSQIDEFADAPFAARIQMRI